MCIPCHCKASSKILLSITCLFDIPSPDDNVYKHPTYSALEVAHPIYVFCSILFLFHFNYLFLFFSSNVSRHQKTQYFWKPQKSKKENWFLFWGCFGLDKKKFLPKLFWFLLALTILFLFHRNNWCRIFSFSETRYFAHEHGGPYDYKIVHSLYFNILYSYNLQWLEESQTSHFHTRKLEFAIFNVKKKKRVRIQIFTRKETKPP